jgi:hypothetical protein
LFNPLGHQLTNSKYEIIEMPRKAWMLPFADKQQARDWDFQQL